MISVFPKGHLPGTILGHKGTSQASLQEFASYPKLEKLIFFKASALFLNCYEFDLFELLFLISK
jgi:hypothetical protein